MFRLGTTELVDLSLCCFTCSLCRVLAVATAAAAAALSDFSCFFSESLDFDRVI